MKRITKCIIAISITVLVLALSIVTVISISKKHKDKENIDYIKDVYTTCIAQDTMEDSEDFEIDELMQKIDGEYVVGVVKIDKIDFEGLVYEGTTLDVLAKGVGHFENSPYYNGNVCLAAHNTNQYWAKLNTLERGDKIEYTSFLGTKEYQVTSKEQISETDWSKLSDTNEDMLTLITCVKGKKELRLCVQAMAIN